MSHPLIPINDRLIERTARRMCEEMGMHPDDWVNVPDMNYSLTHYERRHAPVPEDNGPMLRIGDQWVRTASNGYRSGGCNRWMMFRADAEKALAAWKAVNATILIDT